MRYNPQTDNAVANERAQADMNWVAKASSAATTTATAENHTDVKWGELARHEVASAKVFGQINHNWLNCCSISHDMAVAEAMGNWSEYRRLRAQLIAGLW